MYCKVLNLFAEYSFTFYVSPKLAEQEHKSFERVMVKSVLISAGVNLAYALCDGTETLALTL